MTLVLMRRGSSYSPAVEQPNITGNWRGKRVSPMVRFTSKMLPQPSGCVYFDSVHDKDGYPIFSVGGSAIRASRFIFAAVTGEVLAEGDCVCHTCDDTGCVNVDHLWRGTKTENNQDRARKGRSSRHPRRGQGCPFSIADIEQMRLRKQAGETLRAIASTYDVTHVAISRLIAGKRGPGV